MFDDSYQNIYECYILIFYTLSIYNRVKYIVQVVETKPNRFNEFLPTGVKILRRISIFFC